ncbi:unnamed protein product, partial [Urochloa humidicola]
NSYSRRDPVGHAATLEPLACFSATPLRRRAGSPSPPATPTRASPGRRAMPSPAAPRDSSAPASLLIFPDEILGEIFLRLDSADDLARASAACTAFLRVARFLRRNRSLYRRPVVGFLRSEGPALASRRQPRSLHHAEPTV